MAYVDAFRTITLAFVVTAPLALLLRKVAAPKASPAEGH